MDETWCRVFAIPPEEQYLRWACMGTSGVSMCLFLSELKASCGWARRFQLTTGQGGFISADWLGCILIELHYEFRLIYRRRIDSCDHSFDSFRDHVVFSRCALDRGSRQNWALVLYMKTFHYRHSKQYIFIFSSKSIPTLNWSMPLTWSYTLKRSRYS